MSQKAKSNISNSLIGIQGDFNNLSEYIKSLSVCDIIRHR